MIRHFLQRRRFDLPAVRRIGNTFDHRHRCVQAFQCEFHRSRADRQRLIDIGLRRDVAGRALQIIGQGPVHFITEFVFHLASEIRGGAAELGMPERVLAAAGIGDKGAVRRVDAF